MQVTILSPTNGKRVCRNRRRSVDKDRTPSRDIRSEGVPTRDSLPPTATTARRETSSLNRKFDFSKAACRLSSPPSVFRYYLRRLVYLAGHMLPPGRTFYTFSTTLALLFTEGSLDGRGNRGFVIVVTVYQGVVLIVRCGT